MSITAATIRNISQQTPVHIHTFEDAALFVKGFLEAGGLVQPQAAPEPEDTEVSVPTAREILAAKGYRVQSHRALMGVLDDNGIVGARRGNNLWFDGEAVRRIPKKN